MKTILFDNIIYSLQQTGGISSQWAMLQNGMLHNVAINSMFLERNDAINNIYRKNIRTSEDKIVKLSHQLPLIIDRYSNVDIQDINPSIFHSSYYRCVKNKVAKSVVTVHDFTYERYMSVFRRYVHCKQKYNAINNADVVVCVSQNTRNDLLHFLPNIDKDKIKVVYNGVPEDFREIGGTPRGDRLLYVGSRARYKNFDFVVEALSETSYHLDICGVPLSIKEQKYLNRKLGKERYKVYSNVDNHRLNELYNQAKCLIYPSSYEGFGLPIVEAQKSGCPVMALNTSSIPEVIGETPLLMSNAISKEFLSKLKLIESPTIVDEIVEAGKQNALKYSVKQMVNLYKGIYEELC